MSSDVALVNLSLTLLGEARIISLDDNVKPAREAKAVYELVRDAALASHDWNFAKTRAQLSALVDAPTGSQFGVQYQLPSDCLRAIFVGDYYTGADLTDYRGSPTEEYSIEGRRILTNMAAPLNLQYIKRVTDPTQFDPCFRTAFSARLAEVLAEPLTQSDVKRQRAGDAYGRALMEAVRVNAISLPPRKLADDEWLLSRL